MARYTVLIVDDEADFREVMSRQLTRRDLQCATAPDGDSALAMVKSQPFDVVLLDVKMPGRDGIDTLREIKHLAPMVEVLILTGHASVETGIDSIKYGAFDYLMKPIDIEPLMEKLDAAYERKRIQQEKLEAVQNKRDMVPPKKG